MITKNVNGENISQAFIDEIRSDSPNIIARLMLGGSELSCDIMNLQVTKGSCGSTELTIGNVIADMLTASVKNLEDTVKGEDIECHIGAWTGEDYEFISLGVFTVSEAKKTRYTTEITAYSSVVGKTAKYYVGDNSNPTIGELGQNIATILGCDITFDPAIDTTQIVMAQVLDSSLYQCLQAVAICSGGYIVNDNAGNILVCRYDSTPTLDVDTGMMVSLPQVDEAPIEVDSVKCNGEYPYSAQRNFLVDEQERYITDEGDNLIYGYDAIENADIEFDCDYMTKAVFDTNIVDIIGYTYWYATIGLTLGDPRLEGSDVLAVTDVDGTIYNVPCHQLTHSYSGGFKSDIVSAQPTQQQNDIGSVTPLGATQELAFQAYTSGKKMGQYFWFVGDGDDAGAHITEIPKDDFLDTPSGGNLLANSTGMTVRDGMEEVAKFGSDEAQIGKEEGTHVVTNIRAFKMFDGAFSDTPYVWFSDLKNSEGLYETTETFVRENDYDSFEFNFAPIISSIVVEMGGKTFTPESLTYYTTSARAIVFSQIPPAGRTVVFKYESDILGTVETYTFTTNGTSSTYPVPAESAQFMYPNSLTVNSVKIPWIQFVSTGIDLYDDYVAKGGSITVSYATTDARTKAFTLGTRNSSAPVGALSFAVGDDCEASGNYSHAEGYQTIASGEDSHAEGYQTIASGEDSHAEGVGTVASGDCSHAEGSGTEASGYRSHAEGLETIASGAYSHAGGLRTIASQLYQTAIGRYNTEPSWGHLFTVGCGTSDSNRKDALILTDLNLTISGTLIQGSDRRIKDHIDYLDDDAVEFVRGLKPAHYLKDGEHHVGFYAQDVEEVDKWDCMTGEMNGYKTLGYTEIIAPLVAYCQHLEKRIEELEKK